MKESSFQLCVLLLLFVIFLMVSLQLYIALKKKPEAFSESEALDEPLEVTLPAFEITIPSGISIPAGVHQMDGIKVKFKNIKKAKLQKKIGDLGKTLSKFGAKHTFVINELATQYGYNENPV